LKSIALLTRYVPEIKIIDDYPYIKMSLSKRKTKSYIKFEEAVEAQSNSLQLIKSEINNLVYEVHSWTRDGVSINPHRLIERLLKISGDIE
jgi:hypothetical protein